MFFRIILVRHVQHLAKSLCVKPISSNMNLGNHRWLNADIQARIDPPPIPLIKATNGKTEETDSINIKIHQYPTSTTSDTYKLKVQTFENGKPEEFLHIIEDFKTGIDGTATTSATGKFNFYAQLYTEKL